MDFYRKKGRSAVFEQREDIFDTRKPRDNFAIGEIIEEKANLIMVLNLVSAFSALPYGWLSIVSWSPPLKTPVYRNITKRKEREN